MRALERTSSHRVALSEQELSQALLARARSMRESIRKGIPARFQATIAAEDVLQEVWLRAFQSLPQFELITPAAIDRWLRALTSNALTDALKSARTQKRGGHWNPLVARWGKTGSMGGWSIW